MFWKNHLFFKLLLILPVASVLVLAAGVNHGAKKKDKDKKKDRAYAMTEAELQAQVMAFADLHSAVISSANREYLARSPSPDNLRIIRGQLVYSVADAFIIAAGPSPDSAFLDMLVMVTLGRIFFEEHYANKYGREVAPLIKGFQTVERDIWQIADKVLTKQQQKELMTLIRAWRRNHPNVVVFSLVRFSDFERGRGKSEASSSKTSGGLFQSVAKATAQVEEARLLAERGLYLGTRMPLMTCAFTNVWLSQVAVNPEVKKILTDFHYLSGESQRLAEVAEKFPDNVAAERQALVQQVIKEVDTLSEVMLDRIMQKVAVEREATVNQLVDRRTKERELAINHLVDRLADERRNTIEEFLSDEKRIGGLLTNLRQTLATGNDVLTSTNTLVECLNLGPSEESSLPSSEAFDIRDYQATAGGRFKCYSTAPRTSQDHRSNGLGEESAANH